MILQGSLTLPGLNQPIKDPLKGKFSDLGSLISALLPYLFVIAGLILFFVIIGAGFTMFASAGNPDKTKKAQQQLTSGLVGFFIIFAAYWIIQLLELIFGFNILGA
jgi:uncharacterized membrane protein